MLPPFRCCCKKFLDTPKEFREHLQNCAEAWEFLRVLNRIKIEVDEGSLFIGPEKYT